MDVIAKQNPGHTNLLNCLPKIRGYVASKIKYPDVVDDVVQETFARTYESIAPSLLINPIAYLITVANSVLAEHWRKRHREQSVQTGEGDEDGTPSLESHLFARQHLIAMVTVLESMPPLRKQVFILRRLHGLSRQDIAHQLTLSEESVKKHITRAMLDITLARRSQGWHD